jgi:hypothetical protein
MPNQPQNDSESTKIEPKSPQNGGRPTKYRASFAKKAATMCQRGATDAEVADKLGVHLATVYRWKHEFPAFCEAMRVGKDAADDRVELALYQQAIDPTQPALAKIFWLKNRRRKHWTDERKVTANLTLEQLIVGEAEDDEDDDGETESEG